MSKESFCKNCRNNRCNMCRGYRNGNRSLRCLCRHTREKPERTPQVMFPEHVIKQHLPLMSPQEILAFSRLMGAKQLPDRVEIG